MKLGQRVANRSSVDGWSYGAVLLYYSRPPERTSTEQNTGVGTMAMTNEVSELTRERRQRWLSKTRVQYMFWTLGLLLPEGIRFARVHRPERGRRVVRLSVQRRGPIQSTSTTMTNTEAAKSTMKMRAR